MYLMSARSALAAASPPSDAKVRAYWEGETPALQSDKDTMEGNSLRVSAEENGTAVAMRDIDVGLCETEGVVLRMVKCFMR